jgi:hypothetical protein
MDQEIENRLSDLEAKFLVAIAAGNALTAGKPNVGTVKPEIEKIIKRLPSLADYEDRAKQLAEQLFGATNSTRA